MASRTNLNPNAHEEKKKPNKRLWDTTAVIYNYVKSKPINNRSASEQILCQQACSITEHFSTSERLALLGTTPATRRSTGPPTPSTEVLKDFEEQREKFLQGSGNSLSSSRSSSPTSEEKEPSLEPGKSTEHQKELERYSSAQGTGPIPGEVKPVSKGVAQATLQGAIASARLGATVVGGIASIASAAINWEMPTGFEEVTREAESLTANDKGKWIRDDQRAPDKTPSSATPSPFSVVSSANFVFPASTAPTHCMPIT